LDGRASGKLASEQSLGAVNDEAKSPLFKRDLNYSTREDPAEVLKQSSKLNEILGEEN
jgi:hypothetical protein